MDLWNPGAPESTTPCSAHPPTTPRTVLAVPINARQVQSPRMPDEDVRYIPEAQTRAINWAPSRRGLGEGRDSLPNTKLGYSLVGALLEGHNNSLANQRFSVDG